MFCIRCGSSMHDSEKYCVICGQENSSQKDSFPREHEYLPPHAGNDTPFAYPVKQIKKKQIVLLISAVLALLAVAGTISFFFLKNQNDGQMDINENQIARHSTSSEARENETELTDSLESNTEQTTSAAETTARNTVEEERTIYINYIKSVLIPKYGLAELKPVISDFTWNTLYAVPVSAMPQENKGILSSLIEDLDNDGSLELLITVASAEASPYPDIINQGIKIYLYRISEYEVIAVPVSEIADDLTDEMTYCGKGFSQVAIVNKDEKKYIFLTRFFNWPGEGLWNDDFTYSFFEVTNEGLFCRDSLSVSDGIIKELQVTDEVANYIQVYDAWSNQSKEEYFSRIKICFDKYGADTSWLESYYTNLVFLVDEWGNSTYSTDSQNLFLPIPQVPPYGRTITSVLGDSAFNSLSGTQTYTISDYSNIRDLLGMQSAVGEMNQPLPINARVKVVPDSQVETEVLHVRDVWNTYRADIDAGYYNMSETDNGIVSYDNGNETVTIEVPQGIEGSPYAKIYTYENGNLIFAFFYNESEENRLYIKNGQLYRWRYTLGSNDPINYDNTFDNEVYLGFEGIAIEQGDRLLLMGDE